MAEETGGSGFLWLIWAAWIYCSTYWWLERLATVERNENAPWKSTVAAKDNFGPPSEVLLVSPKLQAVVPEILSRDGSEMTEFVNERLADYEAIIAAFEAGDDEELNRRVSPEVYGIFSETIAARDPQHPKIETVFSRIQRPEIIDGMISPSHMRVSIRFKADAFKLARDRTGKLIEGSRKQQRTDDIWTFERALPSAASPWFLVETDA